MSNIVEPDDFAVGRVKEGNAEPVEVERARRQAARVSLGLCQDVLGTERELFSLDDPHDPPICAKRVVGGPVICGVFLERLHLASAQRLSIAERRDLPTRSLERGVDQTPARLPFELMSIH